MTGQPYRLFDLASRIGQQQIIAHRSLQSHREEDKTMREENEKRGSGGVKTGGEKRRIERR
jgi:hypothetical protein